MPTTETAKARIVTCPQCGQDSIYAPGNPYRPFCSHRCKQIDLGAWSSESYRMPEPEKVKDNDTDTSAEH